MLYVIAYDIGTTGLKTCLFSIGETIEMIAGTYSDYDLYILENGGAEQDADQWLSLIHISHVLAVMRKSRIAGRKK